MQKKLIALAVAGIVAAPAFAQSSVTAYGRMDVGYLNAKAEVNDVETKYSSTGFQTGALTTSRLGFKGSEDLGNGLSAFFQLEVAIDIADDGLGEIGIDSGSAQGNPFSTRLGLVGLKGSFGSVTLGRQTTAVEKAWGAGAAGATNNAYGALYTATSLLAGGDIKMNNTRSSRLITYMTPDLSGFSAAVQYGNGSTNPEGGDNETTHKEFGFNAGYANGPLNVVLGYSKESGEIVGVDSNSAKQLVLGANYDFGVVKAFGTYARGDNDDAGIDKSRGWELGLNAPVGPVVLIASYFDAKQETTGNYESDLDGYQLAALYPLSKRTIVYAMYGHQSEDGEGGDDAKITNYAFGVRHDF